MIAAFDPDGILLLILGVLRLLVALVRVVMSGGGSIVLFVVGCVIIYFAADAARQWLAVDEVPGEQPDATGAPLSATSDGG